jgi:hypothetical protein
VLGFCTVAFSLPAQAWAGYGVQPSAGATAGVQPTFLVYLDSSDSLAEVYVSASTAMSSSGFPASEIGSCSPTTPFGEPNKFTCQPSGYSNNSYSASLPPGTYYWWLSYWTTDPDHPFGASMISGPFAFTVAAPQAPTDVYQVSPADGARTTATPTLSYHVPAGVTADVYVSDSADQLSDGSPASLTSAHCSGVAATTATYTCSVASSANLVQGATYYWWVVVTVNGSSWYYPARSFIVAAPPPTGNTGGGTGTTGGGGTPAHAVSYAPYLPSSDHYSGKSVKQTRLSLAAYRLSEYIGRPRTVAVACWSTTDWTNISGGNPESGYTLLGFWKPAMPRWLQLSPGICHTMETLLYKRPEYSNRYTATAVDTLTHEMIHALGVRDEAATECYAMQLNWVTSESLGVPTHYAYSLSRQSLENYSLHPPSYINRSACRENGAWDLFKGPSLPWHNFQL